MDCHDTIFLENLKDGLVDGLIVLGYNKVVGIDLVDLGRVDSHVVCALDQNGIVRVLAWSVYEANLFIRVLNPEIFGVLSTVKFDAWHTVTAVETRVVSLSKLIKLIGHLFQVLSEGSEANCELLFLLFQVHQSPPKAGNQVVAALTVQFSEHLLLESLPLVLLLQLFILACVFQLLGEFFFNGVHTIFTGDA